MGILSFFRNLRRPKTIDAIAQDVYKRLSDADKRWFRFSTKDDLYLEHHGLGREIRNAYGLWHDHPLTKRWRTDEKSRTIIDDVDESLDHPDATSMRVLVAIRLIARQETQ